MGSDRSSHLVAAEVHEVLAVELDEALLENVVPAGQEQQPIRGLAQRTPGWGSRQEEEEKEEETHRVEDQEKRERKETRQLLSKKEEEEVQRGAERSRLSR